MIDDAQAWVAEARRFDAERKHHAVRGDWMKAAKYDDLARKAWERAADAGATGEQIGFKKPTGDPDPHRPPGGWAKP